MNKEPAEDTVRSSTAGLFARGALDTFPLIVAATPFAIIYGALALKNGLSFVAALSMSTFVFAGASQFVAVTLVGASAPLLIIIATVLVVNLRHILYSIRFMPNIKQLPKWQRVPMAFWMTDESFSVTSRFIDQKILAIDNGSVIIGDRQLPCILLGYFFPALGCCWGNTSQV